MLVKVVENVSYWVIGEPRLVKKDASWVDSYCSIFDSWSCKIFSSASFIIELLLVKFGTSVGIFVVASKALLKLRAETAIEEFGFGGSSSIDSSKRVKFP